MLTAINITNELISVKNFFVHKYYKFPLQRLVNFDPETFFLLEFRDYPIKNDPPSRQTVSNIRKTFLRQTDVCFGVF